MKNADKNLTIWDQVKKTDPAYTKQYQGGGGFRGTSINSTYQVKKATEIFGPIGIGWGYEILDETITDGHPVAGKDKDGNPIIVENAF